MTAGSGVYIEGAALEFSWADARRSLTELIFDTVIKAVDDAGQGWEGIDSIVLAAQDLVDGRSLSSMVTAPAAGAYLRDEIRYGDDGAAAFVAGVTRIEAGDSVRTVVAAWGRASEHDVDAISRVLFDPVFLAGLGLEELHISALNAQKWRLNGGNADAVDKARAKRDAASAANPRALHEGGFRSAAAYPLEEAHLPRWGDVVAAVVISGNPAGVRVRGLGQSSDAYYPGDRALAEAVPLREASERALREAAIDVTDIDVIEVDGLTLYDEGIALEAIGRAPSGQGLEQLATDASCNPSGGGAAGYCAPAMGLVRIVEATLQLQRRAGAIQQGSPRTALASGSSILAGQTQTVVILEAV